MRSAIALLAVAAGMLATPAAAAPLGAELRLARRLAAQAEASGDALTMLAAARIAAAAGLQRGGPAPQPLADAWFARAEALAAGRAELLALIADARAARSRQSVGGGVVQNAVVRATGSLRVRLSFQPGTQALFGIDPETPDDLRLKIFVDDGRLVCERLTDKAAGRGAECEWRVDGAGAATIDIDNRAARAVELTYYHN